MPLAAESLEHLTSDRLAATLALWRVQADVAAVTVGMTSPEVNVGRHGLDVVVTIIRRGLLAVPKLLSAGR